MHLRQTAILILHWALARSISSGLCSTRFLYPHSGLARSFVFLDLPMGCHFQESKRAALYSWPGQSDVIVMRLG